MEFLESENCIHKRAKYLIYNFLQRGGTLHFGDNSVQASVSPDSNLNVKHTSSVIGKYSMFDVDSKILGLAIESSSNNFTWYEVNPLEVIDKLERNDYHNVCFTDIRNGIKLFKGSSNEDVEWITEIYLQCEYVNPKYEPTFTITYGFNPYNYELQESEKNKIKVVYDCDGSNFKRFKTSTEYKSFLVLDCELLDNSSIQNHVVESINLIPSQSTDMGWNTRSIILGNLHDIHLVKNMLCEAYSNSKLRMKYKPLKIFNVWIFSSNLEYIKMNRGTYQVFMIDPIDDILIEK